MAELPVQAMVAEWPAWPESYRTVCFVTVPSQRQRRRHGFRRKLGVGALTREKHRLLKSTDSIRVREF